MAWNDCVRIEGGVVLTPHPVLNPCIDPPPSSLFPSSPVRKSYYCPTTPLRTVETMPTHSHTPTHPHKTTHLKTHWDLITPVVSIATTESVLSNSGSSKFNESWPSNSEVIEVSSAGGVASESCRGSNAGGPPAETLAK